MKSTYQKNNLDQGTLKSFFQKTEGNTSLLQARKGMGQAAVKSDRGLSKKSEKNFDYSPFYSGLSPRAGNIPVT
jgi:hypothetical protein